MSTRSAHVNKRTRYALLIAASKVLRAQQAKDSLLRSPPDEEERLIIHDLFMSTLDQK